MNKERKEKRQNSKKVTGQRIAGVVAALAILATTVALTKDRESDKGRLLESTPLNETSMVTINDEPGIFQINKVDRAVLGGHLHFYDVVTGNTYIYSKDKWHCFHNTIPSEDIEILGSTAAYLSDGDLVALASGDLSPQEQATIIANAKETARRRIIG